MTLFCYGVFFFLLSFEVCFELCWISAMLRLGFSSSHFFLFLPEYVPCRLYVYKGHKSGVDSLRLFAEIYSLGFSFNPFYSKDSKQNNITKCFSFSVFIKNKHNSTSKFS